MKHIEPRSEYLYQKAILKNEKYMAQQQKIGSGWSKTIQKKDGTPAELINFQIGDKRYVAWKNTDKKGERSPDWTIYEDTYVGRQEPKDSSQSDDLPF